MKTFYATLRSKKGSILLSADQHFGQMHGIKSARRPFNSIGENDRKLIALWNKSVTNDDIVFHLGDLCKHNAAKYVNQLNFKALVIVKGNHDKWMKDKAEMKALTKIGRIQVVDEAELTVFYGKKEIRCYLSHRRRLSKSKRYAILLHGHLHGKGGHKKNAYDVGVDANKYRPVSLRRVFALKDVGVNRA